MKISKKSNCSGVFVCIEKEYEQNKHVYGIHPKIYNTSSLLNGIIRKGGRGNELGSVEGFQNHVGFCNCNIVCDTINCFSCKGKRILGSPFYVCNYSDVP